jgi:hypothetical protein
VGADTAAWPDRRPSATPLPSASSTFIFCANLIFVIFALIAHSVSSDTSHSLHLFSRSILDMQYSIVKACLLALAATTSVFAQIDGFDVLTAPAKDEVVKAGTTYSIKWAPTEPAGPISLILMQGATNISLQLAEGFLAGKI